MLIDARQIPENEIINCDICIVGSGAAGITLAHEFLQIGMSVILLESGGMEVDSKTRDLDKGDVLDPNVHDQLELYRRRTFGGTTVAWTGRCVPYDEIDFEQRTYVPYSGWPFPKSTLDPYYSRAHSFAEVGNYSYDPQTILCESARKKPLISGFQSESIETDKLFLFSPPTNFGKKYRDVLVKSSSIKIFLHATCLKISTNQEGNLVESLKVASLRKNEFSIIAKQYILAAGGLENTRLLLLSNDTHANGIGNKEDLVGRFYMGHITNRAEVQFKMPNVIWDFERTIEGIYCKRAMSIKAEKQIHYELLNHRVMIGRPDIQNPSHKNGVFSATYLAKSFFSGKASYETLLAHTKNVLVDSPSLFSFSKKWIPQRLLAKRKLPSVMLQSSSNTYMLCLDSEQTPNPSSRVSLSDRKDDFGQRRLKVDWQCTEFDMQSMLKTTQLIVQSLLDAKVANANIPTDLNPTMALGGHHIGTTRMSVSSRYGVVDENCKVHGVSNLFIASSSVFPTSSHANPTLTIIAIAIRLADYIKNFYLINT
jgi:choline dehydrogenase-like flavoprotein